MAGNKLGVVAVGLLLCAAAGIGSAYAASLTAGSVSGTAGKNVSLPVTLATGNAENISALTLGINFDESIIEVLNPAKDITLSKAAFSSGKILAVSHPAAGTLRVVIYGGRKVIGKGVVIQVKFAIKEGAPDGVCKITLIKPSAADPDAKPIILKTVEGQITIKGLKAKPHNNIIKGKQ